MQIYGLVNLLNYLKFLLVSPLKYLALVFGIIFGYLIWDEIPTIKTLLGALLVVSSSLIILRREIYHKEKIPSTTRHE